MTATDEILRQNEKFWDDFKSKALSYRDKSNCVIKKTTGMGFTELIPIKYLKKLEDDNNA